MKKLLLFILFIVFINISVVFAQTCDCEALQAQIDDLNNQINILKGYGQPVAPEVYEQNNYFPVGDYMVKVAQVSHLNNIKDQHGKEIDELAVNLIFRNDSIETVNFDDTFILRIFQRGRELELVNKYQSDLYIRPGASGNAIFYYELLPTTGVIEIEIFPILSPQDRYSGVIFNIE